MGDILGSVFGYFVDVANFLELVTKVFAWVAAVLKYLGRFLQHIWEFLVKRIIGGIINAIRSLSQWLEDHLQPIIDYLKRERAWLQHWYEVYVRPFMIWMQRVRQVLHILAFLHIHIAQRLDDFLGKLQAKIIGAFYTLTGAINVLTNILLALQDPQYLIKHPVLLISIRRQIPALIHALTGRPPGYFFPSPKGKGGGHFAPPAWPFNFADRAHNPPTSSYLSNDGLPADLAPLVDCYEYTATSVDEVAPLDYFDDELYPTSVCPYDDPAKCLLWSWGIKPRGA